MTLANKEDLLKKASLLSFLILLSSCGGGDDQDSTNGSAFATTSPSAPVASQFQANTATLTANSDPRKVEFPTDRLDSSRPLADATQLAVAQRRQDLADYVNTMRGANSSGNFTRGNTFPATAVPFGFNFWTPVNRSDKNWFYQFKTNTDYPTDSGSIIPTVTEFAVVHEPSPWIGNRQSLSIMPVSDLGKLNPENRGQTYSRANETAHAHYYSLIFDNGLRTEITPTDHAAVFRFTIPDSVTHQTILFDRFAGVGDGDMTVVDATNGIVSGMTDFQDDKNAPPLYFYARFSAPIMNSRRIDVSNVKSWLQFATPAGGKVIEMKIATSFISRSQAKANLEAEIGAKNFDMVMAEAKEAWNDKLNIVQVEGATEAQKITLYSNLYRAFLYPNSAWEMAGGKPVYMSPYTNPLSRKEGKIWVNNGFWDTYRTTWPLYALVIPKEAGEMIDGFVNAYKDGGWVPRWSGPDYRDSMVATSSDVIFADAYLKGVRNFDVAAAYESMLKNATVYSGDGAKGRKGMNTTPFYGYSTLGSESVAWSLEANLNDFGIAQMAKALGKDDDAAYLYNSAISYANMFDGAGTGSWAGGFFRQKSALGAFGSGAASPTIWGYAYTEGNAWSYAFLAPQDGQGLANLYGGRAKLKERLDAFFTTVPQVDYTVAGSYGSIIHEIKEARASHDLATVGQYQHSNQPVHHSIYMYNYAGSPASGQKYLRDVMDKLYTSGFDRNGLADGSGYIGDEDNGEQSAWYVFSAMGFYPVSVGRPEYAIGAPYFPKMTVTITTPAGERKAIEILAPGVSSTNRYVQGLKLNGRAITRSYLTHAEIAAGATLEFQMGPNPSANWGTAATDLPTSLTAGNAKPAPLQSILPGNAFTLTASSTGNIANLSDRNSLTEWSSASAGWIQASTRQVGRVVKMYTVTSSNGVQDPTGWTLKGSNDGANWTTLDTRIFSVDSPAFTWRRQIRPFQVQTPASYTNYKLEFTGQSPVAVSEFELLASSIHP
ncbi:GH92 family glycosyl hydrolase [Labrys portucalensis]|uniref:GH92 family glycosyl hydrolase n=1 Tax=Labrys neptuniae TaxID=376174 RepID=A0ABV6ZS86_9HYPH